MTADAGLRPRLTGVTAAAAVTTSAAAWVSCGVLTVTSAAGADRVGLLPPMWMLPLGVVATLALFAALRLSSDVARPFFLSALLLLPWAPVKVPDVVLLWTGPIVLLVWAAIALRLAAASRPPLAQGRPATLYGTRGRLARNSPAIVAGALAFAAFVAAWSAQRVSPIGDEPHYLLLAQSLLLDGDIRVGNNYDRGDYRAYVGGPIDPHIVRSGVNGERYSIHAPGIAALIAPAFAIGGYRAAAILIALVAAIASALLWMAAHALTGDVRAAWFGWAAATLTVPGLLHGALIYPDPVACLPIAAVTLALVRANGEVRLKSDATIDAKDAAAGPWRPAWSAALGTAVGALPFLHTRLVIPAAVTAALMLRHFVRGGPFAAARGRHVMAFVAPMALAFTGWIAMSWFMFGTLNAAAPYGDRVPLGFDYAVTGFLGLLVDQQFGLIPNAPIYLVSLAGLLALARDNRRPGIELMLLMGPYTAIASAYHMWWGGASPPARFLMPTIVPLGVAAAVAWARAGERTRAAAFALLAVSVLIAASLAGGGDGALAYNAPLSTRARWLDWAFPLANVPAALPSFFRGAPSGGVPVAGIARELVLPAVVWALALATAWLWFSRGEAEDPAGRHLAAFTCLAAGVMIAVQATWMIRGVRRDTVMATRSQLAMLGTDGSRLHRVGVGVFPPRLLTPDAVRSSLRVSTAALEPKRPGELLFLTEVPPGTYRLEPEPAGAAGEVTLEIGRASGEAARWPIGPGRTPSFDLPLVASALIVRSLSGAIERVALVQAGRASTMATGGLRARDAVRYGATTVFAVDDRVALEPPGFWVLGGRRPDVVFAPDPSARSLALDIRNGAAGNHARVSAGRWSDERTLAADEHWAVQVPLAARGAPTVVTFEAERGFRPADVDPSSRDRRSLGFWVEVR